MNKQQIDSRNDRGRRGIPILSVILSVVCAISLWFYVVSVEDPTYTKTFDGIIIEFKNESVLISEGLSVMSGKGVSISVTVRGRRSDINRYTEEDITAYVDVSEINVASKTSLPVQTEVPEGLIVTETSSSSIEVYADKPFSKVIPIDQNIDIDGYIHTDEYDIGEVTIRPDATLTNVTEISINGPQSRLDSIVGARVKPILLNNAIVDRSFKANIVGQLELYSEDEYGEKVILTDTTYIKIPNNGEVSLNIPVTFQQTLPISVVFDDDADAEDYIVEHTPNEAEAKSEISIMDNYIANGGFTLTLNGTRKDHLGTHTYTLSLPDTVEIVSGSGTRSTLNEIEITVTVKEKEKPKEASADENKK